MVKFSARRDKADPVAPGKQNKFYLKHAKLSHLKQPFVQ